MRLNARLVREESVRKLSVFGVLLNGSDSAASGSLGGDEVLEGDGEEVSLIGGDIGSLLGKDVLELVYHIFEALGLLGNSGEENVFFNVGHSTKN